MTQKLRNLWKDYYLKNNKILDEKLNRVSDKLSTIETIIEQT